MIVFTSISRPFDDQQQPEHEQQVVDAEQDVLHAELNVAEGPLGGRAGGAQNDDRRRRPQQMALEPAVCVMHAHQHVGDRGLEARDRDSLARDAARARERPAHHHGAGLGAWRSGVASRQPSGTTGAIRISTSPPLGRFHRKE